MNEPIKTTRCKEGSTKSCIGKTGRCIAHGLWQEMGERIQGFLASVIAGRRAGAALRRRRARVAAE